MWYDSADGKTASQQAEANETEKGAVNMLKNQFKAAAAWMSVLATVLLTSCGDAGAWVRMEQELPAAGGSYETIAEVPDYEGEPYVEINDNEPEFTEEELVAESYESYSELDGLGRCGTAQACIGEDLMPDEERGDISSVKPTGWKNKPYDNVDGEYLYNRCHLIGFQLSGENANVQNLITGTRYMNTEGMLPFENIVAEYVKETDNHVMYRVTPVFEGENLVASGVQMEAESVEDDGIGISFNVYIYNVQPEIYIDYATGDNWEDSRKSEEAATGAEEQEYILNKNTKKFHDPDCSGAVDIKKENKEEYKGTRESLIEQGYEPCGRCKP